MNKKKELIFLVVILLIAFCLRFFQLGSNPASLYWDEAAIGLDAYSIATTGKDMNNQFFLQPVLGSYGDFKAPVLIWLVTPFVRVLGMTALAIRLPVALFSVLSVYLAYRLLKELLTFDDRLARRYKFMPLLLALIMAISPWTVHFGRIGFESSLSVAFLLLALLFFLKALKNKGHYFLLSALFASVAVYSYYSLRFILPLFYLALMIIFFKEIKKNQLWRQLILALCLFVVAMIPILSSPYYARSQEYRFNNDNLVHHQKVIEESSQYLERYGSNLYSRVVYHRYLFVVRDFLSNMAAHFSNDFLFFKGDANLRQHSGYFGEFLLVSLPFYYLGLFLFFKNYKSKLSAFLLVFMLLSPIPAAMVYEVPHASRAIYLFVPFSILIAWGINEFILFGKKIAIFVTAALLLMNAGFYYSDYFIEYPKRSSEAWLYSYNQVALYLKEHYQEFSKVEISERYWLPRIFVYYQFPQLLDQTRELKNALLNNPVNSFGLADPFAYLLDPNDPSKKQAKFIYYQDEIPAGFYAVQNFDFLNGDKSLILVVKDGQKSTDL
jgi:4-amino-4-deoxy-L-arabinose transferase-like glycosyltransferase